MVTHMGWVLGRPVLTLLEVAWRWLVGIPLLALGWWQATIILAAVPPEAAGLDKLDITNPWVSAVRLADAWDLYRPYVEHVLVWLAPVAALLWVVVSAVGRNLVLKRIVPSVRFRPVAFMALQAAWLLMLAFICWGWFASVSWAAATHIGTGAEPELVGYTMWVVFLSLGFFTLWALVSWYVAISPLLMLLEGRGALSSLQQSLRLGRVFTGKLVEINLVMGIVKLALLVVAMVFSSVLIPFSEEIGTSTLHVEWVIVTVFYLVTSDYFQVVRLKGFVEFWRAFRANEPA